MSHIIYRHTHTNHVCARTLTHKHMLNCHGGREGEEGRKERESKERREGGREGGRGGRGRGEESGRMQAGHTSHHLVM